METKKHIKKKKNKLQEWKQRNGPEIIPNEPIVYKNPRPFSSWMDFFFWSKFNVNPVCWFRFNLNKKNLRSNKKLGSCVYIIYEFQKKSVGFTMGLWQYDSNSIEYRPSKVKTTIAIKINSNIKKTNQIHPAPTQEKERKKIQLNHIPKDLNLYRIERCGQIFHIYLLTCVVHLCENLDHNSWEETRWFC